MEGGGRQKSLVIFKSLLLQGSLKVYPLPDDGTKDPSPVFSKTINTNPVECVVRVYVIRVSLLSLCVCVLSRLYIYVVIFYTCRLRI